MCLNKNKHFIQHLIHVQVSKDEVIIYLLLFAREFASKGTYSPCRSKIINIHREAKTPRNKHRTKPPGMLKNQNLNAIISNQLKGKSAHNFHITLYQ